MASTWLGQYQHIASSSIGFPFSNVPLLDRSTPDTKWNFCPSTPVAYLFLARFALTTLVHLFQAVYYRKVYGWVVPLGALWQTIAYAFRIISIKNPASLGDYAAWFVLILVSARSSLVVAMWESNWKSRDSLSHMWHLYGRTLLCIW